MWRQCRQRALQGDEGLVAEARKHAIESEYDNQLRDLVIIAQYQRMSHYGLAGFGTAAAYANALRLGEEAAKLKAIASDICKADEYTTRLAEHSERAAAKTGGIQDNISVQRDSSNEQRPAEPGTVGRTTPDQSKERNTELAIEAGRQGPHPEDKP